MMDAATVIVRADGAGELIVWVVLGVIWAIAQAVTKAREKRRPAAPPPPPRASASKMHQELEEFFAELQRQHEQGAAQPPAAPPAPSHEIRIVPAAPPPRPAARVEQTPPPLPEVRVRKRKPVKAPAPQKIPLPSSAQAPAPQPGRVAEPTPALVAAEFDYTLPTVPRGRSGASQLKMLSDSKGFVMRGMSMLSSSGSRASAEIRNLFVGRSALRNALIGRIVMGPSRAAKPWSYPSD